MMTCVLPVCQLCGKDVESTVSTVKDIFTATGKQEVLFTLTLSCGCVIDFPDFSVDLENGTQSVKDRFTGQVILTFDDEELFYDEDDE